MRIALVSPYDWCVEGGVNRHIRELATWFRAAGHEVAIFAPASEPDTVGQECFPIGRPVPVRTSGSVQRISLGWTSRQVRAVLAEGAFDIVHLHEPLMPLLPYQFLRHSRAVNVGTFHAAKEGGNRMYRYTRPITRRWFRRLDGKIAVSRAAARLVGRYFPGYFNIIPNGIDFTHFAGEVEPLPEFCDGRFNVLFVGRPEKRKGLKYLLRAYTQLRERLPGQTRLIVVGAGGFQQYQRAMRDEEDVVFRTNVAYDDLPRYHRSAHVFCSPATGNESQGIAVLEAMASGLPVVASNIEGFASMVVHGREGLLVEPRSPRALCEALFELQQDGSVRERMGIAAREQARHYSWDTIAHQVLSYYERLLYERRQVAEAQGRSADAERCDR